ncbi:MAG: alpha/beta hydrolase [Gammaproteobacteria bacterium]|nr:alpha/beta hydrolase [Gammaproteobacteria bacterium]
MEIYHRYRTGDTNALILFIHGLGGDHHSFDEAWESEALQHYALLAPDLPGCGNSPLPSDQTPTMPFYAKALDQLLLGYTFEHLHIVAHSMGSAPGLLLTQNPQLKLASFVNVEGNLVSEDAGMLSRRTAETDLDTFRTKNYLKLIASAERSKDRDTRYWAEQLKRCPAEVYHAKSCSLVEWSDSGELLQIFSALTVPKLYVYGDRSVNLDVLKQLDAIPQQKISECGHFVMSEQPEAFYSLLAGFLEGATTGQNT